MSACVGIEGPSREQQLDTAAECSVGSPRTPLTAVLRSGGKWAAAVAAGVGGTFVTTVGSVAHSGPSHDWQ